MKWEKYFNPEKPSVTSIRERHKDKVIDLNRYPDGLTRKNVVDANQEASYKGKGLIIPAWYEFWDKNKIFRKTYLRIGDVQLNTALRFKKFGDEIDLYKRKTTKKEMKERFLTPRKAFGERFSDPKTREVLRTGSSRGWGYWDVSTKVHRLIPYDVPAEGHKFREFFYKDMRVDYQFVDCHIFVPSISGENVKNYELSVNVLPVTETDNEYLAEWTKTGVDHTCPDRFFRKAKSKVKEREDRFFRKAKSKVKEREEFEGVFKYANPEIADDRHTWAAREIAEDEAGVYPDSLPVLVKMPRATGLMGLWYTLKTSTLIGTKSRARRPTKAEICIACGWLFGYVKPEELMDLRE